mgnify:CR=1 FL=1
MGNEEVCRLCLIIYGFEEPRMEEVVASRNLLVVLDRHGNNKKIYIVPKRPIPSIKDYLDQNLLIAKEAEDLADRVGEYIKREFPTLRKIVVIKTLFICKSSDAGIHECVLMELVLDEPR